MAVSIVVITVFIVKDICGVSEHELTAAAKQTLSDAVQSCKGWKATTLDLISVNLVEKQKMFFEESTKLQT